MHSDFKDKAFWREVMKELAKIHNLTMPLSKKTVFVKNALDYFVNVAKDDKTPINIKRNAAIKEFCQDKTVLEFDFEKERNLILSIIARMDIPVHYCHNDFHIHNTLVRTDRPQDGNRIVMVDYEFSCYNYRNYDFGKNFYNDWYQ